MDSQLRDKLKAIEEGVVCRLRDRVERWSKIPKRNAEICERRAGGETLSSLASSFGISRQRVEQICKAYGVPTGRRSHLTDEERNDIVAQHKTGSTVEDLSIKYNRCEPTIRRVLAQAGLDSRPRYRRNSAAIRIAYYLGRADRGLADIARAVDVTTQRVQDVRDILKGGGIKLSKLPRSRYGDPPAKVGGRKSK